MKKIWMKMIKFKEMIIQKVSYSYKEYGDRYQIMNTETIYTYKTYKRYITKKL